MTHGARTDAPQRGVAPRRTTIATGVVVERDAAVSMRDGVLLAADVYRPARPRG